MTAGMVAFAIILAVGVALVARQYQSQLRPRFRLGVRAWRIIRLGLLLLLAYGLLVSGRPSLQIAGLLFVMFAALYVVLEWQPRDAA